VTLLQEVTQGHITENDARLQLLVVRSCPVVYVMLHYNITVAVLQWEDERRRPEQPATTTNHPNCRGVHLRSTSLFFHR